MKITAIELNKDEQEQVFEKMIKLFDLNGSAIYTPTKKLPSGEVIKGGQLIELVLDLPTSALNELIEVGARLELSLDTSEFDEYHQNYIKSQSVVKFTYWFMFEGDEATTNDFDLDQRIRDHYSSI